MLPLYCAFGTDDRLARIEAAKVVFAAVSSKDKTFDVREEYRHVLLSDLGWESVADTMAHWIVKRTPSRTTA